MANIINGRYGLIGIVLYRPMNSLPQPHWNTATSTPYAAAIDSRFMSAALSGTRIDRNTITSKTNDIATIEAMKIGSRLVRQSVRSVAIARPVSDTVALVPSTVAGRTSDRRWWTSASVRASCGDVVGLEVGTAVSPASWNTGAVTAPIPGSACSALWTRSTALRSARAGTSTTTWIGPLNPGPKPRASSS